LFVALLLCAALSQGQDLTFDSARVTSPTYGARVYSFTATATSNCNNAGTSYVDGQNYTALRVPVGVANLGADRAYLGLPGVTPGVAPLPCFDALMTLPGFVTIAVLDTCGTMLRWNQPQAYAIQNSSIFAYNPTTGCYYTNYYTGAANCTAGSPNATLDYLTARCGPLDLTTTSTGLAQLSISSDDDSLWLVPGFMTVDGWSTLGNEVDITGMPGGNYYLQLVGNFTPYEAANCYPNELKFPISYDATAATVSFLATGWSCGQAPLQVPGAPQLVSAEVDGATPGAAARGTQTIVVRWQAADNLAARFITTPAVVLSGNTERALTSLEKTTTSTVAQFTASELRGAQELNGLAGLDKNNLRFRFKVRGQSAAGDSPATSSGNPAVIVK
jgi:hypothetical protein